MSNDKHESHVAHGYLADSLPEKQQIDADQIGQLLDARGVNASGHHDQLQRGYGFLSICGLALNVDVAWIALGSSYVPGFASFVAASRLIPLPAWSQPSATVARLAFCTSCSSRASSTASSAPLSQRCVYLARPTRSQHKLTLQGQLASAVPSAGGVYSWASVTPGPRAGRVIGYFAGLINFFGWLFDLASIVWVQASLLVQM